MVVVVVVEVAVVVVEEVVVVVVLLFGGSEVPEDAEPEDDADASGSAGVEAAGATLGTGSACSVPGAAGKPCDSTT